MIEVEELNCFTVRVGQKASIGKYNDLHNRANFKHAWGVGHIIEAYPLLDTHHWIAFDPRNCHIKFF